MYGAREGGERRTYVADLPVIERNGDICIDFANIGFVNGRGGEGEETSGAEAAAI